MVKPLEILFIGHCCHDVDGDRYSLGGSVAYGSLLAQQYGHNCQILTSVGEDFQFENIFTDRNIEWTNIKPSSTTIFNNIYVGDLRTQYLQNYGSKIELKDLDSTPEDIDLIIFAPIANEIDFACIDTAAGKYKAGFIQGWLRQWDEFGIVEQKPINWENLKGLDIIFLSEEDIDISLHLNEIKKHVSHVIITNAGNGAKVFYKDEEYFFPAHEVECIDPTGAGDIFSTSYLLAYLNTKDFRQACHFAHAVAAIHISKGDIMQLPSLGEVQKLMAAART